MFFAIILTVTEPTVLVLARSLGAGTPTTGHAEPGAAQPAELGSAAGKSSDMAFRTTKLLLIPSGVQSQWVVRQCRGALRCWLPVWLRSMRFQIFSRGWSRISVTHGYSWRVWSTVLADWLRDTASTFCIRYPNLCFFHAIWHSGFNNYIFEHCRRDHSSRAIAVEFFCILTASLDSSF